MSLLAPERCAIGCSLWRLLQFRDEGSFAESEHLLGRGGGEQMHPASDNSSPSGLMVRTEAGAVVAMEVFVEQEQVPPVGILLKLPRPAINRPPPVFVSNKDVVQSARKLVGD